MKRLRSHPPGRALTAAAAVSAAALMLGVSQAATVGFNFQWTYCSYSYAILSPGALVTADAFGLDAGEWVSLEPMCIEANSWGNIAEPYTLKEAVGVPNGSVRVTWSAACAGVGFFAGYQGSPPGYRFTGFLTGGPGPGEQEVYYAFLCDGLGFTNQPGYWVDVVGLKSLFTNSPFVVQLVASFGGSTNSTLTNAFIIDAAGATTQSVSYPNIPPAVWGSGGLSTASGALDTDRLRITGAPAQSGEGPPSFYHASTLSGFILTDQPVVTMSPQPVLASAGDTVLLRAIAIGVPPLACQWRQDGVPIPGATNLVYGATDIQAGGDFDLVVTNFYGATTSAVATVTVDRLTLEPGPPLVVDSKPAGIRDDGQDLGATWLASSRDSAGIKRVGVMQFTAAMDTQIVLPTATTNFDFTQGTVMFWMRSAGTVTNNSSLVELSGGFPGVDLLQSEKGTVWVFAENGAQNSFTSRRLVYDWKWHHLALVYDQAKGGLASLYIDGTLDSSATNADGWGQPAQQMELGGPAYMYSPWVWYDGLLDDFRIYSRQLTQAEIASVVASDALVDTNSLQVRLSFDVPPVPGVTVTWQSGSGVLQSATTVTGPYTDVPLATSPYRAEAQPHRQFFRYRHQPAVIYTNPFDM
jgi:hypothetical protein